MWGLGRRHAPKPHIPIVKQKVSSRHLVNQENMNRTVEAFATLKDIPHRLAEYLPIVAWLPRYEPGWLRFDLLAGLTAAAVVIPQAIAYATIAGLPVQAGLYTALTPMLIYVLLGTSRR